MLVNSFEFLPFLQRALRHAGLCKLKQVEQIKRHENCFGYCVGVANLLRAIPDLEDGGRKPLVDGTSAGVKALAQDGLAALTRGVAPKAIKLSGFQAEPILKQAIADPSRVASGALRLGPLRQATLLARIALLG